MSSASVARALVMGAALLAEDASAGRASTYGSGAACVTPCVDLVEVVAEKVAAGDDSLGGAGDAWGGHQSRIVRTSRGEIFVSYLVPGRELRQAEWRVARRNGGQWKVVGSGIAGREPASLLRLPDDRLIVVAWPHGAPAVWTGTIGTTSVTWTQEAIPGPWAGILWPYVAAGVSARGRLCVLESVAATRAVRSSHVIGCRDSAAGSQWTTVRRERPYRFAYAMLIPTDSTLTFAASRDVLWADVGMTRPSARVNAYAFNAINVWIEHSLKDASAEQEVRVREEKPSHPGEYVMAHPIDLMEEHGRLHLLYNVAGPTTNDRNEAYHAIISDGRVIWDERLPSPSPGTYGYHRLVADGGDHLYWLYAAGTTAVVFPATSPDARTLGRGVPLDLKGNSVDYAGIFVASPRGGSPWASGVDMVFPSNGKVVYAHVKLSAAR